jgi:hypothetical protein
MIEIIIMIGVVGNFLLQLSWFIWTLKNHKKGDWHKHIENDEVGGVDEVGETETEIVTNSIHGYEPTPKSRAEVFGGEKKYDPNKIKGAFDEFFE